MNLARPVMVVGRVAPKTRKATLDRERHEPDYSILVAVVALAAVGILMVYSSSAIRAYLGRDDSLAIVGPQIQWAGLGIIAMLIMMRVDYRLLRLASIPGYVLALILLVLVLLPAIGPLTPRIVGGSARCSYAPGNQRWSASDIFPISTPNRSRRDQRLPSPRKLLRHPHSDRGRHQRRDIHRR